VSELSHQLSQTAPLVIYFLIVVLLVLAILGISHLLGERHNEPATGEPFESGVVSIGDTHLRFSAPYFLMAILFVIFDLEAAFIYAYAVAFRQLGWGGYIEVLIFIGILAAALAYLWRSGALEWGPQGHSRQRPPPQQGASAILRGATPPVRAPEA